MKKIIFILVVLLFTAPAWADIEITATQVGTTPEVEISYEVTAPDVNLPRAFGLDITVSDGNIIDCIPYMTGECTADVGNKGFGIFPGTIVIDVDGNVTDDGTPVAPSDDPGSVTCPEWDPDVTGCSSITVEMGSLYQEPNYPGLSGVLCTITVTENCIVTIAGNAARCGTGSDPLGVVMEDPDEVIIPTYVPGDVVLEVSTCWDATECAGQPSGDATCDGSVNINDLYALIDAWGMNAPYTAPHCRADFTQDGAVNLDDLYALIDGWGSTDWSPSTGNQDCP